MWLWFDEFGLQFHWRVFVCAAAAAWRSPHMSREWQKEENGFLRPPNAHHGCLYRSTHKAQGIYMVTHRESSPLYNIKTLHGNTGNTLNRSQCSVCRSVATIWRCCLLFLGLSWRPCGTLLTQHVFVWHFAPQSSFSHYFFYIFLPKVYFTVFVTPESIFHNIL